MLRVLVCVAGAWGPTLSDREVRGAQKKKYPKRVGPGYLVPGQVFHSLSRQPVNRAGRSDAAKIR
jgi:hypothetical protein